MSKVEILKFLDDGTSGLNPETPIKRFTFEDADFNVEQVRKNRKNWVRCPPDVCHSLAKILFHSTYTIAYLVVI